MRKRLFFMRFERIRSGMTPVFCAPVPYGHEPSTLVTNLEQLVNRNRIVSVLRTVDGA